MSPSATIDPDALSSLRTMGILDKLPQGLCVFDGAQRLVLFNRRFGDVYGIAPDLLRVGMSLPEVLRLRFEAGSGPDLTAEQYLEWRGAISERSGATTSRVDLRNGHVIEIYHEPMPDGGWVATHEDITDRLRSDEALRQKTALLDVTLDTMDQGLMMIDAEGFVRVCNERAMKLLDLPPEIMRSEPSFASILNMASFREGMTSGGAETKAHTHELEIPGGTILDIRTVRLPDGSAVQTYSDITERKQADIALAQSRERLALALESGSDGLWDWDVGTGGIWFSERWWEMLGYSPGEIEPHIREWFRLIHPQDEERARAILLDHCSGQTAMYECEYRLRRRTGDWAWVLARGKVVARDVRNNPLRIVGTHIDITSRKEAEGRIAHLARHDPLTDLPNRTYFREQMEHRLLELRRDGGSSAVLCLDLDRFKAVNDTLGHLAGDALLREVAVRLRAQLRREDTVARLGGDEFAVLLGGRRYDKDVEKLAYRLIEAVQQPVIFCGQPIVVGLSIGIAIAPEHGEDSESLLRRADLALYSAKSRGRNTARFFEPAMDEAAAERRVLEVDLRQAIASGALNVYYQPQVRVQTGELTGFEALARWTHPTRGEVPPSTFIPLAEEAGLIVALGEWVLREACREAARWGGDLRVAVNLSPGQFANSDLPEGVRKILCETGLPPARLELEITENAIIGDMPEALAILHRLRCLGLTIAMDDFGTGYSSLATLQAFPFDRIKIDRSFVGRLGNVEQASAIVRAVLGLGRSLGIGVVAEGVETPEQLDFLRQEACEEAQGYLFGRPAPIEAIRHMTVAGSFGSRDSGDVPVVADRNEKVRCSKLQAEEPQKPAVRRRRTRFDDSVRSR